jgi:hypothetical protein
VPSGGAAASAASAAGGAAAAATAETKEEEKKEEKVRIFDCTAHVPYLIHISYLNRKKSLTMIWASACSIRIKLHWCNVSTLPVSCLQRVSVST